jgi:translocation and assembly module TamB
MSGRMRIARNAAIGLAALSVLLLVGTVLTVRTDWFRNYVKQKIITATEEGTGGKVDIGSFEFAWSHLRVVVTDFVIHGDEPAGSDPFVRAARVELDLRLFTSIKSLFELSYLGVDKPEVNVMVFADGRTNVPIPKQKSTSNTTTLETVVDLAIGHFELTNGLLKFNSQQQTLDVKANNLRAQLWYKIPERGYRGQISLQPIYVISGRNTPVTFTITAPVALQRDRIEFQNARISTAASEILINGSIENLRNPKTEAHISGHLALVDLKNLGDFPLTLNARNVPSTVDLDANATVADNAIQVTGLRLGIGHSTIEASGALRDPTGKGSLQFKSDLALGELGRLANLAERPDGRALLNGTATLDANQNYEVAGNLAAQDLSFQNGKQRISHVNLMSAVRLDSHRLDLNGLRLSALGGEFAGDASLEDFARYKLNGNLRHLDWGTMARALGQKDFPYSGAASGPIDAEGDLKAPGTKSVIAHARLVIAPGRKGIPVSGRLNANYNGATDNITVSDSYIALPHTRVTLNGSLGNKLNVSLSSRDLSDVLAAVVSGAPPVRLNGGEANFTGVVTGSLSSPHIMGHLTVSRFSVEGRQFDLLAADVTASGSAAAVANGSLTRSAMQAQFTATVGLKDWSPTPSQRLSADAAMQNGDLADILAIAGQPSAGYSGALSMSAHVTGTLGNPTGTANLVASTGTVQGEPFDRIEAQVNMADQLITIPAAYVTAGPARINLATEFQHPRDSWTTGRVHAHVQSNQVELAQFRNLQKQWPNTVGQLQLQADVIGNLGEVRSGATAQTEFQLTSVNADASAHNLRFEAQNYGDFTATARTSGQTVNYNVVSDFAGSNIRVNGNTQLARGYPTNADASLKNLPIERVLALARRIDIPARGILSGTAHVAGTIDKPEGNVDLDLANAVLYDEPIDHLRARVTYLAESVDVPQLEITAGPSRIDLTAHYDHSANSLQAGDLQFKVNSSRIDLARIRNLQNVRPGLGGTLQITADGAARVRETNPRVLFRNVNANVAASGIASQGKSFGDLTLVANTGASGRLNFTLNSNLANAAIQGHGTAELRGDYPVDAQVAFNNVTWTRVRDLVGSASAGPSDFEAVTDGQITVVGPVMKTAELNGSLQLTRLQLNTIPSPGRTAKPIVIQNQGPIAATLERGLARIASLHLTGPQTDIQATGTVSLQDRMVNASLNANTNLGLLQSFDRDVTSSGSIVVAATVRGTTAAPLVNGRIELHDASVNHAAFPNGISNANGVVMFNGNSASVQNITAESGGGTLTIGGFASFADVLRMGLRVNAAKVRIRLQQGVSVVADASINLTGTMQGSVASGTVTIEQVTYNPQSDFGSLLSAAAPPIQSPTAPSPLLDNMRLDIRVRTSDAMAVQASLAQNLQSEANLRIRGTASQPGVLGRVTITEGQLVFFSSSYTVNSGTISFYNPTRIEPILNISLETKAKGVDVALTVTGPIDNMKLSYTSDPPLQFQEIVGLLASGKTPTSDPTLLANQPSPPPQSFQQMGESALLSKALADPVSSRLQRVFGVSQLKVDPTFTSGSELPQARLTLQQQISSNVTFTYITALNDPNTQIIRAEWAFNQQWSAIATRDQNGIFSVNFFYKKQFR